MFFVVLTVHWINWLWYLVTARNKEWFPPKDLDIKDTDAFTGVPLTKYWIFYYYGVLTLVGGELMPTNYLEVIIALFIVCIGTVFIGLVIGEFTTLLSNITK